MWPRRIDKLARRSNSILFLLVAIVAVPLLICEVVGQPEKALFWSSYIVAIILVSVVYAVLSWEAESERWDERGPMFILIVLAAFYLSASALFVLPHMVACFKDFGGLVNTEWESVFKELGGFCKGFWACVWRTWYFSAITIATVGYGDIAPTRLCRLVSATEPFVFLPAFGIVMQMLTARAHALAQTVPPKPALPQAGFPSPL